MPYTAGERLQALRGGNGIGATVLLTLTIAYEAVDAAGNIDFLLSKAPQLRGLMNALPSTNLLILIALLWIIAILLWPAELGPHGGRVRQMKTLLEEAARFHAKHGETVKKFSDDSVHEAAWRMSRVFTFLEMGFRPRVKEEFIKNQSREHEKHKAADIPFDPDRTISQLLSDLRRHLKAEDLDLTFHMPDSYQQFYKADGWIPNSVKV